MEELKLLIEAGENLGEFGMYWVTKEIIGYAVGLSVAGMILFTIYKLATSILIRVSASERLKVLRKELDLPDPWGNWMVDEPEEVIRRVRQLKEHKPKSE